VTNRSEVIEGADQRRGNGLPSLIFWVLLSLSAGFLGALTSLPGPWYARLEKPAWTPPNWVFGPAWTCLYLIMGIAAWLVWRRRDQRPGPARSAIRLFLIQLALNAAWSWLFFGLKRPDVAFAEIVVLWTLILIMVFAFARVRALAGLLILPYLAWVTFAAALNASIWLHNLG